MFAEAFKLNAAQEHLIAEWHRIMRKRPQTENCYPPIPTQQFDWVAYYVGRSSIGKCDAST